jgi:hypothetical protein
MGVSIEGKGREGFGGGKYKGKTLNFVLKDFSISPSNLIPPNISLSSPPKHSLDIDFLAFVKNFVEPSKLTGLIGKLKGI